MLLLAKYRLGVIIISQIIKRILKRRLEQAEINSISVVV